MHQKKCRPRWRKWDQCYNNRSKWFCVMSQTADIWSVNEHVCEYFTLFAVQSTCLYAWKCTSTSSSKLKSMLRLKIWCTWSQCLFYLTFWFVEEVSLQNKREKISRLYQGILGVDLSFYYRSSLLDTIYRLHPCTCIYLQFYNASIHSTSYTNKHVDYLEWVRPVIITISWYSISSQPLH